MREEINGTAGYLNQVSAGNCANPRAVKDLHAK